MRELIGPDPPMQTASLAGAAPDELADLLSSPTLDGWDLALALTVGT